MSIVRQDSGVPARDAAVKDLDQLYNQAKTSRAWLEPIWILNLAYY